MTKQMKSSVWRVSSRHESHRLPTLQSAVRILRVLSLGPPCVPHSAGLNRWSELSSMWTAQSSPKIRRDTSGAPSDDYSMSWKDGSNL